MLGDQITNTQLDEEVLFAFGIGRSLVFDGCEDGSYRGRDRKVSLM